MKSPSFVIESRVRIQEASVEAADSKSCDPGIATTPELVLEPGSLSASHHINIPAIARMPSGA